jgi:hypothetical protein
MPLPHLLGLLPEDLEAMLARAGVAARPAETRRMLAHAISLGLQGFPTAPRRQPVVRAGAEDASGGRRGVAGRFHRADRSSVTPTYSTRRQLARM